MIDKEMAIRIVNKIGSYGDIVLRSDLQEVAKFIDYQDKEIERLNKENTILKQTMCNNSLLINENALLKSIIKEAREYIQDRYDGEALTHTFDKDNVKELLEILDKVEENK